MLERKKTRIQERNGKKILDAGEKVFAEFGFHGATLEKVASLADMSQPNLHHYFRTKADLYLAVIEEILSVWLASLGELNPDGEPAIEIRKFILQKMELSRKYPAASRIFAHEMLLGAPVAEIHLRTQVKDVADKSAETIRHWIKKGKVKDVDPYHLIFMMWASTQHYADFLPQVKAVRGVSRFNRADYVEAGEAISKIILDGIL